MRGEPTTIAGIALPSGDPTFLALVALHVAVALVAVASGALAMLSRKEPGRHPGAGTVYYWSLSLVLMTAAVLAILRWPEDNYLLALGASAFVGASLGRMARRREWPLQLHVLGMGSSYILMLIAFYMDNGKSLPIWKDLPTWTYWGLPVLVGSPILTWALFRHPLMRRVSQ